VYQFGLPRRDTTDRNSPKEIRIHFRFELEGSDADRVEHSAETESLSEASLVNPRQYRNLFQSPD
jgi:hypothetical protein